MRHPSKAQMLYISGYLSQQLMNNLSHQRLNGTARNVVPWLLWIICASYTAQLRTHQTLQMSTQPRLFVGSSASLPDYNGDTKNIDL